jgi:hypothetical protein
VTATPIVPVEATSDQAAVMLRFDDRLRYATTFESSPRFEAQGPALPPDAKRQFAQPMGAMTIEIPSSHVAMFCHPAEVADLVEKAADAVSAAAH